MLRERVLPQSRYRIHQVVGLVAGPVLCASILFSPAPEGMPPAAWHTAAVGALMAVWWMTEAIPIPATALLPLAAFPLLGVADVGAAAAPFANPLIFLFLGGFVIALAMERWNLHRRMALNIIRMVGTRPHAIVVGFAVSCAFLSMWVSNTATALMMLPIGLSVVELVRRDGNVDGSNFAIVLMLVIAYSCSIGGMATLIGTPPNAFFAAFMLETYDVTVGFSEWMQIGLPFAVVSLPAMVLLLTRVIYPIRIREVPGGREYIREQLLEMGRMKRPEKMVGVVFGLTACLWTFRPLLEDVLPGLSDAGIAISMALVLFVLPADRTGTFVMDWKQAERLPWGVLVLFGGGLSLAGSISDTGLAEWLGGRMGGLTNWPLPLVILAVTATVVFLTELTSNLATTAAFLPVLASVSVGLGHDPMVLAVPAVLAASCAFMLPVATPPNAIIFGSSFVTLPQMARAGLRLNLFFIVVISIVGSLLIPLLSRW